MQLDPTVPTSVVYEDALDLHVAGVPHTVYVAHGYGCCGYPGVAWPSLRCPVVTFRLIPFPVTRLDVPALRLRLIYLTNAHWPLDVVVPDPVNCRTTLNLNAHVPGNRLLRWWVI